jgi:hypothetical protein
MTATAAALHQSKENTMKRPALAVTALSFAAVVSGLVLMSATSVAASSLPTLTLALTKNAITVGGAEVSGAVNIVSTVSGEPSDSPSLFLLRPGVTAAQFGKAVGALPSNSPFDAIDPYASIVFDGSAVAGAATTAQTWLQAGNYVATDNGNGFAAFTVTQSAHPMTLPVPGATVRAIDFAFRGASTLHDGELVRFVNDGYLIHMFVFVQAKSLADAKAAEQVLLSGNPTELKGAAKKYGTGVQGLFAGPLSHAELQQEVINEPPGVYVIFCEMNAQDGRDHFQLGMFRTITIVK